MSNPISPAWNQALHAANWAHALHAHVTPAHLHKAAAAQAPNSWQAAAYRGAGKASSLVHSPLPWATGGAVLATAAVGIRTGSLGAAIVAYPAARLAFGDSLARGTADKPASAWEHVQTYGVLGLPERLCLHAARTATAAAIPGCRPTMLGIAVGLRALIQVPRAMLGLVSVVASLFGAALDVLAHALTRAFTAIGRFPANVMDIITQLKAQYAYWENMFATGAAMLERITAMSQSANRAWQRVSIPASAGAKWACRLPEQLSPSLRLMREDIPADASAVVVHRAQEADLAWLWSSGATACMQGVVTGAQTIGRGAELVGRAMARVQEAMLHVARLTTHAQRSQQLARAYMQVMQAAARLPQLPFGWRLPAV